MRYPRFLLGVLCVAASILLGLGDLFLLVWNVMAGQAHDIRARGPWLLAFMLPQIGLASALLALAVTIVATRRDAWRLWVRLSAPLLATMLIFVVLYLDPRGTLWRALRPIRQVVHSGGAVVLDLVLLGIGIYLLRARQQSSGAALAV